MSQTWFNDLITHEDANHDIRFRKASATNIQLSNCSIVHRMEWSCRNHAQSVSYSIGVANKMYSKTSSWMNVYCEYMENVEAYV